MIRKFITPDGDVLEEADWSIRVTDSCFYCDQPLRLSTGVICHASQDGNHDWITLVNPSEFRR